MQLRFQQNPINLNAQIDRMKTFHSFENKGYALGLAFLSKTSLALGSSEFWFGSSIISVRLT
jgi:hypothetical protein